MDVRGCFGASTGIASVLTFALRMKNRILISAFGLGGVALTWLIVSVGASLDLGPTAAKVRFSDNQGSVQIEARYAGPFELIVSEDGVDQRYPSSVDPITRIDSASAVTSATFRVGSSTGWSSKITGVTYQAGDDGSEVRFCVSPLVGRD